MSKLHIKKGDQVLVLAGKDKGVKAEVLEVLVEKQRAIVKGVNIITKHAKPSAKNLRVVSLRRSTYPHL